MKLVIGITEASGVAYGLELQAYLRKYPGVETYTVITEGARERIPAEMRWTSDMVDAVTENRREGVDGTAMPLASDVDATILAPCSVERVAAIANANGEDWLAQTVDACLMQKRPVVVLLTQARLEPEHLELMLRASRRGAVLLSCPDCHTCSNTLSVMSSRAIAQALEILGIECAWPLAKGATLFRAA